MSDRKNNRLVLPGLIVVTLVAAVAVYIGRPDDSVASPALEQAKSSKTLQSLAELDGKNPTNRQLNVQTWNTAEGAKVLFVEAHELPMFDMRILFAAGSSQDGNTPGLALLTNAMLNEGVPGKDVGQIAAGFEGLGADFSNGAYRDMALVSLRSLSAADKREAAITLFDQVIGQPTPSPPPLQERNGVPVAVIGQAFPYTPIANPRHFVPDWSFGIQEENMQKTVDEARAKGAKVVVVLSHNGMDVDLKMASRVRGIDAIMGGHTHDGVPEPVIVSNGGGKTLVTNAGSNSKFLGVLDFDVRGGQVQGYQYRLLPVFSNILPADREMDALITRIRAPYEGKLHERLAVTEGTLYRRGNFNGSFDQLIVDALMDVKQAEIAFSPGFRWGTSLLPNSAILMEHLMDQTATTYSHTTVSELSGATIKTIMEDVADNLFNPDPYYQQGGDMVRVGGMTYAIDPKAKMGARIQDMRLNGKPIDAAKVYKVAGWAPVAEGASGEPVWDVVGTWLRSQKTVKPRKLNAPRLIGVQGNPGIQA
eukprot:gene33884-41797_t